ncbi:hypothetical protein E3P81_01764 [Wallemia ichthyophaga]|nr:hypothetical protein E3P97_01763 [Wallemia ichthyophaga]TIB33304.1 hypothetical protein E3P85_01417 [Wallemia ichthyophaga]TIB47272.1 hypothetical protein E3P82_01763 [Wallemia ichthyophaga]TIB51653.1 hypothetical protein E3P81_01764 [Wallemia ichthyophaga]TIB54271.1 hypothetical protein E3P80_01764 [Wallemia ichthyophaga]
MLFDKFKKDQMSQVKNHGDPPPIDLELVGQELPWEWSMPKKSKSYIMALLLNFVSAFNATGNSAAKAGVTAEFGISGSVFLTSSFTYNAALGLGPLFLAPLSESYGRRPMIVGLLLLIVILFLPQALAPNIESLSITRLFQGLAASIEGPHVAGIITDLFHRDHGRGVAMATFTLIVFTANALGPLCCNWLAFKTDWPNIYWMQMAMNGAVFLLCMFLLDETRHDVILDKKVRNYNKTYGTDLKIKTDAAHSFKGAMSKSLARPIVYLLTEPIVMALALWVGFAWGMVFLFTGATPHVYEVNYGFNQGESGTVLICGFIGAFLAWLLNFGQNALYKRSKDPVTHIAPPEARLYQAALGAVLFGAFEFMFGWTARPWITPWVSMIAVIGVNFGIFPIYAGVYTYIGDAYEQYSSSAQAAQALLRNLLGATFPFFATAMFDNLSFPWASSTIGFIALALSSIPFTLLVFGGWLRARSRVCKQITREQEEDEFRREQAFEEPGEKRHAFRFTRFFQGVVCADVSATIKAPKIYEWMIKGENLMEQLITSVSVFMMLRENRGLVYSARWFTVSSNRTPQMHTTTNDQNKFKKTSQVVSKPATTEHNMADDLIKQGPPLNETRAPRDAMHSLEHDLANKGQAAGHRHTDARMEDALGRDGKKYHKHPHDIAADPRLDSDQLGRQNNV